MKKVNIISKVVGREGTGKPTTGRDSQGAVDLSAYLLKQIWDSAFELKEKDGVQYLFGKIPLVLQYGLTSFADEGLVDLPSLFDGIPIDNQTLYWEETTDSEGNVVRLLKAKGGSENLDKETDFQELKQSFEDFLSGSDTDTIINKWKELETFLSGLAETDNLAAILESKADKAYLDENFITKDDAESQFVTIGTAQTITGAKNFTGGLSVNGCELVYDSENKYWKLEGDLLVTGSITSFADDTAFTPSTIMDALVLDPDTLKIEETTDDDGNVVKRLTVIGGTSGESNVQIVSSVPSGDEYKENTLYVVV